MSTISCTLFGYPLFYVAGRSVSDDLPDKGIALLALLLVDERVEGRERLVELLWPEVTEEKGRTSLRRVLYQINAVLPTVLTVTRRTVSAEITRIQSDVHQLQHNPRPPLLRSIRGDFMQGFYLDDAPEFERWREQQARRLRQLLIERWRDLATDVPVEAWSSIIQIDALREEPHRELMCVLARNGEFGQALDLYRQLRDRLFADFAVEPSAETEAVAQRIRQASRRPHHNLPTVSSTLFGRDAMMTQVRETLTRNRFVTLTGMGGIGKTRLSLAVAHTLADNGRYLDGVAYMTAQSETDGERTLADRLLKTLVRDGLLSQPPPRVAAEKWLTTQLANREQLLVLDNLDAVGEQAILLATLLDSCPDLHLLVTARERLRLRGETVLPLPALDDMAALDLFRATVARLGGDVDEHVAPELVALCGGLPLAIEIVAAMTVGAAADDVLAGVQARLDTLQATQHDRPASQRSVVAVLEDALAQIDKSAEITLFSLTLFCGTFSSAAAQAVGACGIKTLTRLEQRCLLQQATPDTFQLHPLVRQLLSERIDDVTSGAAAQRHAVWFSDWLLAIDQRPETDHGRMVADDIMARLDDLKAAWRWLVAQRDGKRIFAFALPLLSILMSRSLYDTARVQVEMGLQRFDGAGDTAVRARLLWGMGHLRGEQGEVVAAVADLMQALAFAEQIAEEGVRGDKIGRIYASLAKQQIKQGHLSTAEQSVALGLETAASDEIRALLLAVRGMLLFQAGRYDEGVQTNEVALAIFGALDNRLQQARLSANIANSLHVTGRHHDAVEQYKQAITLTEETGNPYGTMLTAYNLTLLLCEMTRYAEARRYADKALHVADSMNYSRSRAQALTAQGSVDYHIGDFEAALRALEESLVLFRRVSVTFSVVNSLALLGRTAGLAGRHDDALRWIDEAITLAESSQLEGYRVMALGYKIEILHWRGAFKEALALTHLLADVDETIPIDGIVKMGVAWNALGAGQVVPTDLLDELATRLETADESTVDPDFLYACHLLAEGGIGRFDAVYAVGNAHYTPVFHQLSAADRTHFWQHPLRALFATH